MTTYAIGDIQGCFEPLQQLLDRIHFDPLNDHLWFCGDLVNRGPHSLATLRFIQSLGDRAKCVLGNHDLHLLALWHGNPKAKKHHTLNDILEAPDGQELIDWLRHQPLIHSDEALGFHMIHAGLPPQWSITQAKSAAQEVESVLRSDQYPNFLAEMYGNLPNQWDENLSGIDRLRFITNCFTRLRYCDTKGILNFKEKGQPGTQAANLLPWYLHPDRQTSSENIVFGHWSTIGFQRNDRSWALDSGCLWGGKLTALCLDNPQKVYQYSCQSYSVPSK